MARVSRLRQIEPADEVQHGQNGQHVGAHQRRKGSSVVGTLPQRYTQPESVEQVNQPTHQQQRAQGAVLLHEEEGKDEQPGAHVAVADELHYTVDPTRLSYFEEYVRRFWLGLADGALSPDFAGIRPKLHGPGESQGDFVIDASQKFVIALFGIESPGLTASLAIGEHVAGLAAR